MWSIIKDINVRNNMHYAKDVWLIARNVNELQELMHMLITISKKKGWKHNNEDVGGEDKQGEAKKEYARRKKIQLGILVWRNIYQKLLAVHETECYGQTWSPNPHDMDYTKKVNSCHTLDSTKGLMLLSWSCQNHTKVLHHSSQNLYRFVHRSLSHGCSSRVCLCQLQPKT